MHDLAGAHFSIGTYALMNGNLPFVNNTNHPLNVLQVRLTENLWGILGQKIYEGAWKATSQQEFISRMQSQLKNFDSIQRKKPCFTYKRMCL